MEDRDAEARTLEFAIFSTAMIGVEERIGSIEILFDRCSDII